MFLAAAAGRTRTPLVQRNVHYLREGKEGGAAARSQLQHKRCVLTQLYYILSYV